jgi:hypothetical protein
MPSKFYDFFDVANNGTLPEICQSTWTLVSPDSNADPIIEATSTYSLGNAFLEDFEYGWTKETTYDLYRHRIDALLVVAEAHDPMSKIFQALMCAALVFTVSGLETLVRTAAKLPRTTSLRQEIGAFISAVEKLQGYLPVAESDRAPLARLFEVRHAIVHEGWRWTADLKKMNDRRSPDTTELLFDLDGVRRIIAAADRFANGIAPIFPSPDL